MPVVSRYSQPLPPTLLVVRELLAGSTSFNELRRGVPHTSPVRALVRHCYAQHGAWMTRAYALGIAAGMQAFALIPARSSTARPTRPRAPSP